MSVLLLHAGYLVSRGAKRTVRFFRHSMVAQPVCNQSMAVTCAVARGKCSQLAKQKRVANLGSV